MTRPTPALVALAVTLAVAFAVATPGLAGAQARSGVFRGDAHATAGRVRVVEEGGRRYVELQGDFRSTNGPDLKVVLHRDESPRSYARSRYVNLGRLRRTSGRQRYAVPDGVDLDGFRSVVIWCERFDVTFGHAVLR